jgi:outer membrane protein assembly factor BamB
MDWPDDLSLSITGPTASRATPRLDGEQRARRSRWVWLAGAAAIVVVAGGLVAGLRQAERPVVSTDPASCAPTGGPSGLVSFDPATGQERWQRAIGEASGPAALDGVVVTVDQSGSAVGVDVDSGEVRWCHQVGSTGGTIPVQGPTVVDAAPVVAMRLTNGDVVGLDPATGDERWRTLLAAPETAVLSVANRVLYVQDGVLAAGNGHSPAPTSPPLAALDPATGVVVPDAAPPPGILDSSNTTAQLGFVISPALGRQELTLTVSDPASGVERWSHVVPGFTAALHGDLVVVIDQTGGSGSQTGSAPKIDTRVTAYATSDGTRRWQVAVPGTPQMTFGAAGLVLVADHTQVLAIDPADGTVRWEADHGSPGQDTTYSEPGSYRAFSDSPSGPAIVGLIGAGKPSHD